MTRNPITFTSRQFLAFEPEQLLDVVKGARFEHYLLGPTRCTARVTHWSCGSFSVDVGAYSFPVRVVGAFPNGRLSLGYMRKSSGPTWVNGFSCGPETVELYLEGSEMNYRAQEGGEWVAVEFLREDLQRAARETLGRELEFTWNGAASFPVPREVRAVLDRMIQRLWRHPASGDRMISPILQMIAEILGSAVGRQAHPLRPSLLKRQRLLARADGFIQANCAQPFDLQTLAAAAGVTARTLQREFFNVYGISPQKWARCRMLHLARSRLRTCEGHKLTVEGIANECGFRHMGRFAAYYFELFGEHPSDAVSN